MSSADLVTDPFDARRVHGAGGSLDAFNAAGVLAAADVHVAQRLARLAGGADDAVLLAIAFAVRAPRLGHVYVDLGTIAATAAVESDVPVDLEQLPWPAPGPWATAVAASPLVAVGEEPAADAAADPRPLRLVDGRLYLDRYWREELQIAADLAAFGVGAAPGVDAEALADGVARLFPGEARTGRQALAAASAVLRRFTVIAGGPGTGKTTTVARVIALLVEQSAGSGGSPPLIALAAPTGKAAARLEEAVHAQAAGLPVAPDVRDALLGSGAVTLHRLLGWRPDSASRFRHHRGNRLPHDVVIVDETSMVSLSLMGRLVEAVRPDARLILVGDPGQLTSVEAGAVLGDVVGPAAGGPVMSAAAQAALAAATGQPAGTAIATTAAAPGSAASGVGDGIVVLDRTHRYAGAIATLAEAIAAADADAAIACLQAGTADVEWIAVDVATADPATLEPVRAAAVAAGEAVLQAARAGDALAALEALGSFRVLCAHRRGPHGAAWWMSSIERWLAAAVPGFDPRGAWYVGRPLLMTENDYSLKLFNGDTGVVVAAGPDRIVAAFERRGEPLAFSPTRLRAVDTVYAMTVHKAQGSQFGTAAVLLPDADSQILTRELLYTAVTRAAERLVVVGTEATIRHAVGRPAARASALRGRLWPEG
ncbi:RecBCD enzyme subunit RecD [Paraconexibacter sp. AEG42_29]|uniref:RecBCD enzyme subunit RecD n=1 Tax=Paraconexibacter sp. AEG42_29 TaxID=2997339 RepID=A0AAU7B1I6_9ACTN